MQILIVGSGGREHALVRAVARSPLATKIYAAPGNPGMADQAELVPIAVTDVTGLVDFADATGIDFVIVGPEAPLALGLVDALGKIGILAFGPSKDAAALEASKAFTKELCVEANIPTARAAVFTAAESAKTHISDMPLPVVVKADGLAAGKGVTIAATRAEAEAAIEEAFAGRFGTAGAKLVIEQFLTGEEVSFFALCDGKRALAFGAAQDHKRVFDGDTGPNTGGMGAYAPAPVFTPEVEARVMREIIEPTLKVLAARGTPFRGVLFAGLMIDNGSPSLIEYNVRFGDPECEVLMALLDCDIVPLLMASAGGDFGNLKVKLKNEAALTVVMAANGYPGDYRNGSVIGGIDRANAVPGVTVLHAGTALNDKGEVIANGGRVLAVTATAPTLEKARGLAYSAVDLIDWPQGFCRRDIGWRAL